MLQDFPEFDGTPKNSSKRSYRTQNTNVERALSQQSREITLLETIVGQNQQILEEVKKITAYMHKKSNNDS